MRYLTRAMFLALLLGASSLAWSAPRAQEPKETGTITGRVTLDGKPAQGVIVMATPSVSDPSKVVERMLNATASPKTTTDSDGRYRLEDVRAGTYNIATSAPTLVSADGTGREKEVTVAGDATVERIDFSLTRGGVISGKITDSEGRPVIATLISLKPVGEADSTGLYSMLRDRMFFTDDRGVYRIFGLSRGQYLVSAGDSDTSPFGQLFSGQRRAKTYYPGVTEEAKAKSIELAAGAEALGVDIKLGLPAKGFVVSGRVIVAETRKPVANTMVAYGPAAQRNVSNTAISNKDDGDDDDDDDDDENENVGEMRGFTITNARGEFRLESVSSGSYQARLNLLNEIIGGSEYYADPVDFEVRSSNLDNLEIAVHRGASINGVAFIENADSPEAREQVGQLVLRASVTDVQTRSSSSGAGKVAPDGTFRIGGLKPGKARISPASLSPGSLGSQRFALLRIERNGVEQHDGVVVQPNEQITGVRVIVVQSNCVIRGHVALLGGSLPKGTAMLAFARSVNSPQSDSQSSSTIDANGNFVIEGVAPGTVEVEVVCYVNPAGGEKGMVSAKQTVMVVSGLPADVSLVLDLSAKERDK